MRNWQFGNRALVRIGEVDGSGRADSRDIGGMVSSEGSREFCEDKSRGTAGRGILKTWSGRSEMRISSAMAEKGRQRAPGDSPDSLTQRTGLALPTEKNRCSKRHDRDDAARDQDVRPGRCESVGMTVRVGYGMRKCARRKETGGQGQ